MPRSIVLISSQQVQALARDEASLGRAKKIGHARLWTGLGRSSQALWGEFRGSKVYQVRVEITTLASSCSCPVRKLPCKHALALLLVAAGSPAALTLQTEPDWVADWLDRRQAARRAKAAKAKAGPKKPVDPVAQAKRAEKRAERVAEGIEHLDRWLCDLVRVGLASVEHSSPGIFEEQARRLVDAQAPGLAARVRGLAELPLATADWPARLLRQLGRLALLVRAYRRIDSLDPALRADLRRLCGWSVSHDSVIAEGLRRRDRFQVIAQELSEEDRVRTERTWLIGQESGASALVLRYLIGGRPSEGPALTLGIEFEAELAYYPGAAQQRALIVRREGIATEIRSLAGAQTIALLLDRVSSVLARQPFVERFAAVLSAVTPVLEESGGLRLVDAAGDHLAVAGVDPYLLLALSGGVAIDLSGEWDGEVLRPSLAAVDGRIFNLRSGCARSGLLSSAGSV